MATVTDSRIANSDTLLARLMNELDFLEDQVDRARDVRRVVAGWAADEGVTETLERKTGLGDRRDVEL